MSDLLFETTTHGKWILAGEHAVLRGHPLLIFPLSSHHLNLKYFSTPQKLTVEFKGEHETDFQALFFDTLNKAEKMLGVALSHLTGKIIIESTIPVGAGMGSSAAYCVALARWLNFLSPHDNEFKLSRELENLFHGESSGADIAAAMSNTGIEFIRNRAITPITLSWQPHCYLSFSGEISKTSDCIDKVKELWNKNKSHAEQIDLQMAEAVKLAKQALTQRNNLDLLAHAIQMAYVSFQQWRLSEGKIDKQIQNLLTAGAVAAKPTGAGSGGYILSLWPSPPSSKHVDTFNLIKIF